MKDKKIYCKPEIKVMEIESESLLAASNEAKAVNNLYYEGDEQLAKPHNSFWQDEEKPSTNLFDNIWDD